MNIPDITDVVDTDRHIEPYEMIDDCLTLSDEREITDKIREFIVETAHEYFPVSGWGDEEWDAWRDKFRDLMPL